MDVIERGLNLPDSSATPGAGYVDGADDGDGHLLAWSLALLTRMRHCSCHGALGEGVGGSREEVLARARIRPQGAAASRLVERARDWIERHIDDEDLSVDRLAFALNMSRTSLHRKLVASIGHPPGELIRLVRLQLAHRLLRDGEGNVSEVAYAVGFVSLSGFSRAYRHHYGEPPSSMRGGCCARPAPRRGVATDG
ncbi:helix-turn-helix transcriptional regulator [Stenotrophomonas sp. GZD-301]|uniref:helix-turn-helix transcriptional regulator n=1 Tax=Stenotrophomonas sp. GZD-301 TaxID=3404814 RepID=UPI003BB5EF79